MGSRDLIPGQKLEVLTGARGAKYIMSITGKKKYFSESAILKHLAKADRLEKELHSQSSRATSKPELPACYSEQPCLARSPERQEDHGHGSNSEEAGDVEPPSRWQVFTGARGGSYTVINGKKRYLKSTRSVHPQTLRETPLPADEEQEE